MFKDEVQGFFFESTPGLPKGQQPALEETRLMGVIPTGTPIPCPGVIHGLASVLD